MACWSLRLHDAVIGLHTKLYHPVRRGQLKKVAGGFEVNVLWLLQLSGQVQSSAIVFSCLSHGGNVQDNIVLISN